MGAARGEEARSKKLAARFELRNNSGGACYSRRAAVFFLEIYERNDSRTAAAR